MLLRVPAFRGAQVASGVVVLTVLAVLLQVRMRWSAGAHLASTGVLAVFVTALVIGTPPAEGRARPWLAALCLSAVGLLTLTAFNVCDALSDHDALDTSLARLCTALTLFVSAAWCARLRGAAACSLIAGISGTLGVLAFVDWISTPSNGLVRWLLLLCAAVLLLFTLAVRDSRPEHAAQLANAGGLAVAAIGVEHVFSTSFFVYDDGLDVALGAGWQLALAAAGFGLMAYGSVDGQRGPVAVGLFNIALFIATAAIPHHGFLWWPLVLLLGGLAFVVVGLRPTTPAPPEPGSDIEPLPPIDVKVR